MQFVEMEIEQPPQLKMELFNNKSSNQENYMKELINCLDRKSPSMVEIVRTEEKIDSTVKVLLDFKMQKPDQYKQIIICCQKERDSIQYFNKMLDLSKRYPEIAKSLLVLKVSNKKKLCIEDSRLEKYDEEIFCKYKRKVDANKCKYYETYTKSKEEIKKQKGLFDETRLISEGKSKGYCSYFTQIELIKLADIIICEHKNIFKEGDKQKDIYQFIGMTKSEQNGTFLFLDEAQYLYEDIQSYNTFHIEQQIVHQSVNKCMQLKQIIYHRAELVKPDKVLDVLKKDYQDLMSTLQRHVLKKEQAANSNSTNSNNSTENIQKSIAFVQHPIALVEYLQDACLEINSLFETHFTKKKTELEKNRNFNNAHQSNAPNFLISDRILQENQLSDLKNLYPMRVQLRLYLDELLSYLFNHIYNESIQMDDSLQSLYIVCDFLYFFTIHSSQPQCMKYFFQDHPEYLKEAICYPILTCTPVAVKNFSKRIFDTASNFVLTSDCVIQRNEQHTTTILGLKNLVDSRRIVPRFELEPQVKFNLMPMFITKWNDQSTFESTTTGMKGETSPLQLRNYVNIINRVQEFTPDGIVVYLPNIAVFMKFIQEKRNDILSKRPVYFESPFCPEKTVEAFNYYKQQCDVGQGAFFFCVANGWACRNLEFNDNYSRCLLILGYPIRKEFYQYLHDHQNHQIYGLDKDEFYSLDTMTRVTQCIKSVYTHTNDYCTIILADLKLRADSDYLPKWANQNLKGQDELTVDDLFQNILEYQKAMGRLYS